MLSTLKTRQSSGLVWTVTYSVSISEEVTTSKVVHNNFTAFPTSLISVGVKEVFVITGVFVEETSLITASSLDRN